MVSIRSLCFSAFRAGSLSALLLRPSSRARSGRALVCVFASAPRAGVFARRWACRLGVSVVVRRHPAGWAVSIPVVVATSRLPGQGYLWPVSGGLRGLISILRSSGLGVF
jgi:hypothetical protein